MTLEEYLEHWSKQIDAKGYELPNEQAYLLGRVVMAKQLLELYFTKPEDPRQMQLALNQPPNCS